MATIFKRTNFYRFIRGNWLFYHTISFQWFTRSKEYFYAFLFEWWWWILTFFYHLKYLIFLNFDFSVTIYFPINCTQRWQWRHSYRKSLPTVQWYYLLSRIKTSRTFYPACISNVIRKYIIPYEKDWAPTPSKQLKKGTQSRQSLLILDSTIHKHLFYLVYRILSMNCSQKNNSGLNSFGPIDFHAKLQCLK